VKPLPPLPPRYTYARDEPYRDEPPTPTRIHGQYRDEPLTPAAGHPPTYHTHPYNPSTSDENIPLALLLHTHTHIYPSESPPSYSVAVRQTHSHRDTLIQYIPPRQVVIDIDEESGEVLGRTDDVRHGVEKVVAMFIVAGLMFVVSGVLVWVALGR
jgi:hypothetical protein